MPKPTLENEFTSLYPFEVVPLWPSKCSTRDTWRSTVRLSCHDYRVPYVWTINFTSRRLSSHLCVSVSDSFRVRWCSKPHSAMKLWSSEVKWTDRLLRLWEFRSFRNWICWISVRYTSECHDGSARRSSRRTDLNDLWIFREFSRGSNAILEPRAIAKAPEGEGCPRCGGYVYAAEQMLARGRVSWLKKCPVWTFVTKCSWTRVGEQLDYRHSSEKQCGCIGRICQQHRNLRKFSGT